MNSLLTLLIGFIAGIILGVVFAYYVGNDNLNENFLFLQRNKYVFESKNLQERYNEWGKDYILDLKESWSTLKQEIDIYKMKEENDALTESEKFPCEELKNYESRYQDFYNKEVENSIKIELTQYCNSTEK